MMMRWFREDIVIAPLFCGSIVWEFPWDKKTQVFPAKKSSINKVVLWITEKILIDSQVYFRILSQQSNINDRIARKRRCLINLIMTLFLPPPEWQFYCYGTSIWVFQQLHLILKNGSKNCDLEIRSNHKFHRRTALISNFTDIHI